GDDEARAVKAVKRVLEARGSRPGQVWRIAQHVDDLWAAAKDLSGAAKKEYDTFTSGLRAKRGDWAGTWPMIADLGSGSKDGVRVEPLVTGAVAFPAMLDAIDRATKDDGINLSTFEFDSDKTSQDFAQHLVAAAKRGVPVRVLWDSF